MLVASIMAAYSSEEEGQIIDEDEEDKLASPEEKR